MQVRLLTQFDTTPARSVATDQYFLHTVVETRLPILRVYTYPEDVLLLGRYHAAGALGRDPGLTIARRLTGGRAFPSGNGFVQFSLIVPHRSFFFSADPHRIAPFQVLNRYVRGVLHGLKTGGVEVFYPGQDFLTVQRLPVGWHSFVTEDSGAVLYEGGVFVQRDMSLLPYLLDRADPQGTLPCQLFMPDQVHNLGKDLGQSLAPDQVVRLLRNGFTQQFGLECLDHDLNQAERAAILGRQEPSDLVPNSRPLRSDLPYTATRQTPLGELQVRFSLTPERTIEMIQFSGDFIANPAGIQTLEHNLESCPLEKAALWQVIDQTFLEPAYYLIGAGQLADLPEVMISASKSKRAQHQ